MWVASQNAQSWIDLEKRLDDYNRTKQSVVFTTLDCTEGDERIALDFQYASYFRGVSDTYHAAYLELSPRVMKLRTFYGSESNGNRGWNSYFWTPESMVMIDETRAILTFHGVHWYQGSSNVGGFDSVDITIVLDSTSAPDFPGLRQASVAFQLEDTYMSHKNFEEKMSFDLPGIFVPLARFIISSQV